MAVLHASSPAHAQSDDALCGLPKGAAPFAEPTELLARIKAEPGLMHCSFCRTVAEGLQTVALSSRDLNAFRGALMRKNRVRRPEPGSA